MIHVHHVMEASSRLVPESSEKGLARGCPESLPLLRKLAADPKRIQPQCLYLNGFADPGSDRLSIHPGVHPRDRGPRLACGQQPVSVHVNPITGSLSVEAEDRVARHLQEPYVAGCEFLWVCFPYFQELVRGYDDP